MKNATIFFSVAVSALAMIAAPSFADSQVVGAERSEISRARVISSTQIIETVYESREVCRRASAAEYRSSRPSYYDHDTYHQSARGVVYDPYYSPRSHPQAGWQGGYEEDHEDVGGQVVGGVMGAVIAAEFGRKWNEAPTSRVVTTTVNGVRRVVTTNTAGNRHGSDIAAAVGAVLGSQLADEDRGLSGGEALGAVIGGVVGNQIGKGSGKTAATAAGALIGSIAGGDHAQQRHQFSRTEYRRAPRARGGARIVRRNVNPTVCEVQYTPKQEPTGYNVIFEYGGRQYSQIMPVDPGEYVDVHVSVEALVPHTSLR